MNEQEEEPEKEELEDDETGDEQEMVEIRQRQDEGGLWLYAWADKLSVLGAHVGQPYLQAPTTKLMPSALSTIMWCGYPKKVKVADFCTNLAGNLATLGKTHFRGRIFADGKVEDFNGKDWLSGLSRPDIKLMRLEASTGDLRAPTLTRSGEADANQFVVWARAYEDVMRTGDNDEIENMGVFVAPRHIHSLKQSLAQFIAGSHDGNASVTLVQEALHAVADRLLPPAALVAY